MPTSSLSSSVRELNQTYLNLLQHAVIRDRVSACYHYGLSRALIEALERSTSSEILRMVENAGENLLFRPRQDLHNLLNAPAELVPILLNAEFASPNGA